VQSSAYALELVALCERLVDDLPERNRLVRSYLTLTIQEMTPAEFAALMKTDWDRWMPIVKASGFTAED
jgi:hypothetical protein